jgi:hypothetical protein
MPPPQMSDEMEASGESDAEAETLRDRDGSIRVRHAVISGGIRMMLTSFASSWFLPTFITRMRQQVYFGIQFMLSQY